MLKFVINSDFLDFYNTVNNPVGTVERHLYTDFCRNSELVFEAVADKVINTVRFLVSIRTDTTNELVVPDDGLFYTDCTSSYPHELPMDDATILSAKKIVDSLFDCGEHLVDFIPRTTLYPVGACIINGFPYVYINVVIDSTLREEENFKLRNCHFEHIQDLSPKNQLEKSLLDSLAIVE